MTKTKKKTKARRRSADWATQLVKTVWPQERDFMERPERYRYVRKLIPQTGCVFCKMNEAQDDADSLVLVRDDECLVVMNKYPYNNGHLLILPRAHIGQLWELPEKTNARLAWWVRQSASILTEQMSCPGLNIGMNHGAVAGAGIPEHLHWHVIPRWSGDTNFFPLIAETKVLSESVEQTYARLKPHFQQVLK